MNELLSKRVVSAVIGIILLALVIYLGGWFFKIAILFLMLLSQYELYKAVQHSGIKPIKILGYCFTILFMPAYIFFDIVGLFILITLIAMCLLIILLFSHKYNFVDIAVTLFGIIYPGFCWIFILMMNNFKSSSYSLLSLCIVFILPFTTDTFAYFGGSLFGKHKLCPAISPGKTVEGSISGLIGSAVICIIIGIICNMVLNLKISFIHFIILGITAGVISQFGDLSASAIKRFSKIKDYGYIMPGHGGILDRFDSVLFFAPIAYAYFKFLIIH